MCYTNRPLLVIHFKSILNIHFKYTAKCVHDNNSLDHIRAFQTLLILKLSSRSLSFSSNLIFPKSFSSLTPSFHKLWSHAWVSFLSTQMDTSSALFHCTQHTWDNCSLPSLASTQADSLSPRLASVIPCSPHHWPSSTQHSVTSPHLYPKPRTAPNTPRMNPHSLCNQGSPPTSDVNTFHKSLPHGSCPEASTLTSQDPL